ncbi:MAG: ABC transporter substrate-binding protein [Actinomycetota bacterium]
MRAWQRTGVLAAVLALALVASACNGGDGEDVQVPQEPGEVSGTVRVIMEEVPDTDVVQDMLSRFNEEFSDVDIQIEALPYDQMRDRIVSSFLASEPTYDMIIVDNPWMFDFASGGFLTPLDDLIEQTEGFDWEDYSEPLREIATVEDQIYGVPFYNYGLALIYRQDLYEEAGLEPPSTLDEFVDGAQELTGGGMAGVAMQPQKGYKIFEEWGNYLFAAGGDIQDDQGQVVLDSQAARDALQTYIELYQLAAPTNSLNWAFDESLRAVSGGNAAEMISYNWMLPTLNDPDGPAGDLTGDFSVAEVPGGKAILGAWYWSIPENSAAKDAAWAFISWIASKENDKERVIQGGAPVRNSVMEDPEVWEQGFGQAYYETVQAILEDAEPLATGPNAEEMIQAVGEELNAAVAGQKSVDEAISEAARRATEILEQPPGG